MIKKTRTEKIAAPPTINILGSMDKNIAQFWRFKNIKQNPNRENQVHAGIQNMMYNFYCIISFADWVKECKSEIRSRCIDQDPQAKPEHGFTLQCLDLFSLVSLIKICEHPQHLQQAAQAYELAIKPRVDTVFHKHVQRCKNLQRDQHNNWIPDPLISAVSIK